MVHIQVKDVNEFAPTFKEPAYKAVVTEGKIYDSILQVEAVDEDCSPQYSQICNYEIVTTDVPFAIDRNGECPERTLAGGQGTLPPLLLKARWGPEGTQQTMLPRHPWSRLWNPELSPTRGDGLTSLASQLGMRRVPPGSLPSEYSL